MACCAWNGVGKDGFVVHRVHVLERGPLVHDISAKKVRFIVYGVGLQVKGAYCASGGR